MIDIISVYQDVARDNVNQDENGYLSYSMFNRMSRRAELRLMDWLTGDVAGTIPPFAEETQKNRDWLSPFITPIKAQVSNGRVPRPLDYHSWDNAFLMGNYSNDLSCEAESDSDSECNTVITLLQRQKFYNRCNTFVEGLGPSFESPIAKQVGRFFEFAPKDLGTVTIEYVRYPVYGKINTIIDPVFNNEVADPASTQNYEWDEFAREMLISFITDTFAIHSREQALKQQNSITGKTVRDSK